MHLTSRKGVPTRTWEAAGAGVAFAAPRLHCWLNTPEQKTAMASVETLRHPHKPISPRSKATTWSSTAVAALAANFPVAASPLINWSWMITAVDSTKRSSIVGIQPHASRRWWTLKSSELKLAPASIDSAQIQLASFTFFACLGSVQRTARGHPNASTAKNNDKETGKLANGRIRSKARPIVTTTASPTTTIKT